MISPVLIDTSCIVALLDRSERHPMDLADACLVWMAGTLKTGRILTLDGDFSIYRWLGHKPFENLLLG